MKSNILVVAAHPDDEVLGCGGTMAKHAKAGDTVHVLILGEGITSRQDKRAPIKLEGELQRLQNSAHKANRLLGVKTIVLKSLPDNRMDTVALLDIVKEVEEAIARHRPTMVYTHHGSDVNVDHQKVHQAVATACRPLPRHPVKRLLFFEVPSSSEWQPAGGGRPPFQPNWFSDITGTFNAKIRALNCYGNEMRPWPHARSLKAIEALVRWRGASVGVAAAEAFVLGRQLA